MVTALNSTPKVSFPLIFAALFPALFLCVYVYRKDRVEKEPLGLLLKLFLLGAISCFPAAYVESFFEPVIDFLFSGVRVIRDNKIYYSTKTAFYAYHYIYQFFGVALVEEGFKFLILLRLTKNNKNFNCLFDGIIYAVFVSLGFAALENVLYVVQYGWHTAFARAVLSVPGHMFFAVMMGYNYSLWHITERAGRIERRLADQGVISVRTPFNANPYKVSSLLIPMLAHATYNFSCSMPSWGGAILLYGFVIFMYIFCFKKINKFSRCDSKDTNWANRMVSQKYPGVFTILTPDNPETVLF